ncbi:hypothetical protein J6590_107254, partial [Homalodisca vitripennis]
LAGGAPPSPLFLTTWHDRPIEHTREELVRLASRSGECSIVLLAPDVPLNCNISAERRAHCSDLVAGALRT